MSVSWGFISAQHRGWEAHHHVSSRVCRGRVGICGLQRATAEEGWELGLSWKHSWDGRGEVFFHVFVYLTNKVIFTEGLTFPAQQLGCVLQCLTVRCLPQTWRLLLRWKSVMERKVLYGFCFGGFFFKTNSVRHSFLTASFLAHETDRLPLMHLQPSPRGLKFCPGHAECFRPVGLVLCK